MCQGNWWRFIHPLFGKPSVLCEPGSKLLVLGMVIQPLIGNPYNGYINPYYWVDDHPQLYGNIGSLDPSTCIKLKSAEFGRSRLVRRAHGNEKGYPPYATPARK